MSPHQGAVHRYGTPLGRLRGRERGNREIRWNGCMQVPSGDVTQSVHHRPRPTGPLSPAHSRPSHCPQPPSPGHNPLSHCPTPHTRTLTAPSPTAACWRPHAVWSKQPPTTWREHSGGTVPKPLSPRATHGCWCSWGAALWTSCAASTGVGRCVDRTEEGGCASSASLNCVCSSHLTADAPSGLLR